MQKNGSIHLKVKNIKRRHDLSVVPLSYLGEFIFKSFITSTLATEYLAGAVLLGAAPCTAMVFVWSSLTKGNPAYTVVQVATNDLIIRGFVHKCG